MDWLGSLGATVIDRGSPLDPALTLTIGGTSTTGAPSGVTGYTVIAAESLAAAALAHGCPHLGAFGATGAAGTVVVYVAFRV